MTKTTEQPHPCNYVNFKQAEQPTQQECDNAMVEGFESKQPNPNIMIFDQIDGCCDIIEKLLKELAPQTEGVWCCKVTHEIWRNNDLKRLKGAFE